MMNRPKCAQMLVIIFTLVFSFEQARATLEYLPESSHYEGSTYYDVETDNGYLRGRIDFAVYDTQTYSDEFVGEDGFSNPGTGRYIYAYQIFNDYAASEMDISSFSLVGVDESSVNAVGSVDDGNGGISPTDSYSPGVWVFDGGYLLVDEFSVFLVLSSNADWIAGSYEITAPDDDLPTPGVPEPATIMLLASGGALLLNAGKGKGRRFFCGG